MFDFHQKRKLKTILHSPYTQGLILVLVLWIGWSAYIRFDIAREMTERRAMAEKQTKALEEQKQRLEEQVKYLTNDRGIEAEMRRQFDVALEGEQVVVILEDEAKGPNILPLATTTEDEPKWYQFWR